MRDKWIASLSLSALFLFLAVVIGHACLTADTSPECTRVQDVDAHGVFVSDVDCPPVP